MIETTIELRKLAAAEGMTLTNGTEFGKEIYLGKNDNADNWYEITDKEAEKLQKEMLPEG
ncbi:MAG: hypothetical protein IKB55_01185 [Clostridia bacterium]|nr:hypothetical protein [Clostridia bacterium]